jgi:hypothetical protein
VIDEMTLFDVEELCHYWRRHPPVHLLVAGFVGYRADDASSPTDAEYWPVSTPLPPELLSVPGVAPGVLPPNMPQPLLDFEELMMR